MEEPPPLPQILSPCSSGRRRRRSCDTNSPEFEFWMVQNPSFPQPNLLSADELFSDGFLLPLHLLQLSSTAPPPQPPPQPTAETSGPDQDPKPEPSTIDQSADVSALSSTSPSKRWKHIFKKSDKKNSDSSTSTSAAGATADADDHSSKEKVVSVKEKKREKKNGGAVGVGGASNVVSAAELNINIWPFSRSRSAGNGGARPPRATLTTRKVSSAPCSRSNSTSETKSRKWPPNSPSRAGVHLGRSTPVWQLRRAGGGSAGRSSEAFVKNAEKGAKKDGSRKILAASSGSKAKVLSLNVPMCIGYQQHLSCRNDESSEGLVAPAAAGSGGSGQIGGGVSVEGEYYPRG